MTRRAVLSVVVAAVLGCAAEARAQYLGSFSWQMAPHCNVITLRVTQVADVYAIEGTDDQCGASRRASAIGTAFLNPDGSVGLGLSIVSTPGGVPEHVDASISLATLSGTWRDSVGRTGAFVFTAGPPASGSPRTAIGLVVPDGSITAVKLAPDAIDGSKILDGSIGAGDVELGEIQRRISAPCPSGQVMSGVNVDGSVTCETVSSGGGGDITAVTAGLGLLGGGTAGEVTLALSFGGSGLANAAARSDHTHEVGGGTGNTGVGVNVLAANTGANNTALGWTALDVNAGGAQNTAVGSSALGANVSGSRNTAIGYRTLLVNTASDNTAVGYQAPDSNTTGTDNAAVGVGALDSNTTGSGNVAVGPDALGSSQAGANNTAIGPFALNNLSSGGNNIAIGSVSGSLLTSGSGNIYLGSSGSTEDNTIRIGRSNTQTRFFIAGARDVTTGQNNAVALMIDSIGQLGTISSTRRVKEDVHDLGGIGRKLQRLRPVRFRYIKPFADGSKPVQYGLIAEEVEEVLPELVARDEDGLPSTVLYHVLPTLLIEEVQRLERERAALAERVETLIREVTVLRDVIQR